MGNSFVIFKNWSDAINTLPAEYQLEAYRALVDYGMSGEMPPDISAFVKALLISFSADMDAARDGGMEGSRRGAPKGNQNAKRQPEAAENNSGELNSIENNSNQIETNQINSPELNSNQNNSDKLNLIEINSKQIKTNQNNSDDLNFDVKSAVFGPKNTGRKTDSPLKPPSRIKYNILSPPSGGENAPPPARKVYGEFKNVFLSKAEYDSLFNDPRFEAVNPGFIRKSLDSFSRHLTQGKTYPNHHARLITWILEDVDEAKNANPGKQQKVYTD